MNLSAAIGVALGGAAGSVIRYAVQSSFRLSAYPVGTLLVNLGGSFLIGVGAAFVERGHPGLRPWLLTGFLGGFTTFSAFSLENLRLLRESGAGAALGYAVLSVAGGVVLAAAGYLLARPPGT